MNTIINNGIFSTGDNTKNTLNQFNQSPTFEVDWKTLEQELKEIKRTNNLQSIKDFATEAQECAKGRNYDGLKKCIQKLGEVGLEIISKTSSVVLTEIIKKIIV